MEFDFLLDKKGYIKHRESYDLEFKESFHSLSISFYLRSLSGMANNRGGQIIFGIKNSPHVPVGLQNEKFQTCDTAVISQHIRDYFSHDFEWHMQVLEWDGKQFGQLWVPEAENKPIICKKNNDKNRLREGAIYYRYRGDTKEIAYAELAKLIEAEKEKEKLLWMRHIQQISEIGPRNIQLLDTLKGNLHIGNHKVLMDKDLMEKIKFVQEGKFVENDGAPALVVKGEVIGLADGKTLVASDEVYPLFAKDLQKELGINNHQLKCILWRLNIKSDSKYHTVIKTGRSSEAHKYSKQLVPFLKRQLTVANFLNDCMKEYAVANPIVGRKGGKILLKQKPELFQ